jgi:serine/threonine protein kinase
MKLHGIFLLFISTLSYAMESNEFPALKTLAVLSAAQNYERLKTKIKPDTIPQDCIDLIERELSLNPDNVWKIYSGYEKRREECEKFLLTQYEFKPVDQISFHAWKIHSEFIDESYKKKYDINFFENKINQHLQEKNMQVASCLRQRIASQCAEKLERDAKEAHKESLIGFQGAVYPVPAKKNNPVMITMNKSGWYQMLCAVPIALGFLSSVFAAVFLFN